MLTPVLDDVTLAIVLEEKLADSAPTAAVGVVEEGRGERVQVGDRLQEAVGPGLLGGVAQRVDRCGQVPGAVVEVGRGQAKRVDRLGDVVEGRIVHVGLHAAVRLDDVEQIAAA